MNQLTAFEQVRRRVETYRLDNPGDLIPFSARLAQQQKWSAAFTARAMREYLRFAALAVAAGHPVSPSRTVDEVWHLHLTDTRRYWGEFREALGRDLHHEPSRGGPDEDRKHADMYRATLDSYRRLFGEAPPADLWPDPDARPSRPGWRRLAPVPLLAALAGCAALIDSSSPGAIQGPAFLELYIPILAAGLIVMALVQRQVRGPFGRLEVTPADLGPYELAYLTGGGERVLQAAVLRLNQAGVLEISSRGMAQPTEIPLPDDAAPVETAVMQVAGRRRLKSAADIRWALEILRVRLENLGLIPSQRSRRRLRWTAGLIMGPALALGLMRLGHGMANHRPVGFLLISLVLATVLTLVVTSKVSRTNGRGQRLARAARAASPRPAAPRFDDPGLPRTVALYGVYPVGLGELAAFQAFVDHMKRSEQGSGSGGDGGSSTGCGSSCGGGGGCGGGCGG
jgi:uncharacterized protein (TIGR04222 family)